MTETDKRTFLLQYIVKREKEKLSSASDLVPLDFLTSNIRDIDLKRIKFLNLHINRASTVSKFNLLMKDIDIAIRLEAGVFEYTLIYSNMKNYMKNMMLPIYHDKTYDLLLNMDPRSELENTKLKQALTDGKLDPQTLAFLRPQELHPARWEDLIKKHNLREEQKNKVATTDLYQCWKCKERKCRAVQLQLRSSDVGPRKPMNISLLRASR